MSCEKHKNKNLFEKVLIVCCWSLSVFGLLCVLVSFAFSALGYDWSSIFGTISTILSIILSFISILYTYLSGNKTLKLLDEMKTQNDELVKKIKNDASSDNYDEVNAGSL